ncbi:MAG: TolC family protein [Alphaproteobacteria bacterium]|nr:TolC family protein [Alphaproteobacteria bacterium]
MALKRHLASSAGTALLLLLLSGCGAAPVALDTAAHHERVTSDRAIAERDAIHELTLRGALARGVEYNLDGRVAALETLSTQKNISVEKLKAIPGIEASGGYKGRSNDGGTSSRSVITGQQSLEPSQSTEQHRRVASLNTTWNLLDTAIALTEARSADDRAGIAQERYIKVVQNIERDVYAAYWRAWVHQENHAANNHLIERAAKQLSNINQAVDENLISADAAGEKVAQISDRLRTLREMNEQLALADIELKSLLSLPLENPVKLAAPEGAENYRHILSESMDELTWEALLSRPEMREEILQKNVAQRDVKMEVLRTLPGADLFLGLNYDGNKFLSDSTWGDFSALVTQSLTSLLTVVARRDAALKKEEVADARRQALSAAILAQTWIARQRLASGDEAYRDNIASGKAAQRRATVVTEKAGAGFTSGEGLVQSQIEAQIETLRAAISQAELQDSYAAMMNTLGRSLIAGGAS